MIITAWATLHWQYTNIQTHFVDIKIFDEQKNAINVFNVVINGQRCILGGGGYGDRPLGFLNYVL